MSIWKGLFGKRKQGDLTPPPANSPTSSATKDRVIRVFISSTFRDMVEDRNELMSHVWPALRKICRERGVEFVEVDLRWGVTEEEAEQGKVLEIILDEVERSRPFFIGILGERYGWVPDSMPEELLKAQPWLNQHLQQSVNELEILHGVFNEKEMHKHAYFYFRDPKYLELVPDGKRQDFITESAQAAEKLVKLKQNIRSARDENICELRESYANPEQLGKWILEDFTTLIDRLYPNDQIPDPVEQESMRHEAYAQSRRLAFVGRIDLLKEMDKHVGAKPLVLTGDSGCGKSAILAEWVASYRKDHPDDLIIQHYIGSTPDSADWQGLVRRILAELKCAFTIRDDIPVQPEFLCGALDGWTLKAAGSRRVVLVFDALDQLTDDGAAFQLDWLPVIFPPNFRVLVSTLAGASLDVLRKRGWQELDVPLFAQEDIVPAARAYLAIFSKKVSNELLAKIEKTPAACNALYLRAVLDELRQFSKYEEIEAKAADYLSSRDPNELYERILTRWEYDFGAAIVRQSLCLIWAARGGLSESELLDLLGRDNEPLPRVVWTPFYRAAAGELAFACYGLAFAHSYLSSAVERKYLCSPQDRSSPHKNLAWFYVSLGLPTLEGNLKALKYLPFHACEANEDSIWINAMTDFGFLHEVVERVDVTTGTDDNGNRIQWHGGYLIVLDEIQRWLGRKPTLREATDLIEPLNTVWEGHPDFVRSANYVMPTLYHELKALEKTPPKEVLDRIKRRIVLQHGPLWSWCERERQKYEPPNRPWASMTKPGSANHCLAFISYRREGGSETARVISQELRKRGIRTFLDVDDLSSGHFAERLLHEIETIPNFIVILTPGCLVRCNIESDWLRREIEHAIKTARNIIPILKDGFNFPVASELPPTMAELDKNNWIHYDHVLLASTIEKLVTFLKR